MCGPPVLLHSSTQSRCCSERGTYWPLHILCDIVEVHCYVVTTGEYILMSMYIAESLKQSIDCFVYMQLTKAYVNETSCNQLIDWFCCVCAHQDPFTNILYAQVIPDFLQLALVVFYLLPTGAYSSSTLEGNHLLQHACMVVVLSEVSTCTHATCTVWTVVDCKYN